MQMQHHFTVPVPVDVAWPAIIDPERVAPCMPGATLSSAEGNDFAGSVKVKLGPISLLYKGTGSFKEVDETTRRVVIDASGKDSRGNGTAAATVTVTLTSDGTGTSAQVDTDLKVTGKPAQLGRGLMSEVGGKILNQFAGNLARSLTGDDTDAEAKPGTSGDAGESGGAAKSGAAKSGATKSGAKSESAKRESAKSGDSAKSGESTKSGEAAKPGGSAKPDEAAKSGGSAKPGGPAKSGESAKSGEASKSGESKDTGASKSAARHPANGEHPTNGEHPSAAEASAAAKAARVGRTPAWRVTSPASERTEPADAVASSTTAAQRPADRADAVITGSPMPNDEAIDLLGAAGTPVLKRVVPVVAVALVVGLLLRRLRRRRQGKA